MVSRQQQAGGTLGQLQPGESGIILRLANDKGPVRRRLIDMGLTPGTQVSVCRVAPMGDPIEVKLRGYGLSLRREDAGQILLCPPGEIPLQLPHIHRHSGMVQHIPDEETLRRMQQDHIHEKESHKASVRPLRRGRVPKVALVGNPNSGKTTLFNALTGSNQYVGNWPGVTVEKIEGTVGVDGKDVTLVDLPGIYSLSPYSMEEIIARNFIVEERPDAVINIVDATNIERNLYLTVQLLELERPMVIALNFMDELRRNGDSIDCERLSAELGVPVVPITARTGKNIDRLLRAAITQARDGFTVEPDDLYDDYTHEMHHNVGALIHDRAYAAGLPSHWSAIKLLEGDSLVEQALQLDARTAGQVAAFTAEYEGAYDLGDQETLIADSRYRFIEGVVRHAVTKGASHSSQTLTDKIDAVLIHRVFAIPLFLLTIFCVFALTFGPLGSRLSDIVDLLINGYLAGWIDSLLAGWGVARWLISLVVDGIIGGVGGVLTFLPQIALLFLFLSILEDSGYMARAAFIMDRLLRRFGLSGKAFIPMLMGFGCTVPALMGTRTVENEKDRRLTMMLIPFMSCSARLPVYALITAAFFPKTGGIVVFSLYVLGLLFAVLSGMAFKNTLFKGTPATFVLELPPYRMPTPKTCALHVWDRVRGFLVKAGTLILVMSVVLWLLQNFGPGFRMAEDASDSILAAIGGFIAPIFRPLGFGTWQAAVSLLTGLIAKEAVVSSMSLFYGFSTLDGDAAVARALFSTFSTPAAAYSFLVFVLLYVPCVAAVATLRKEMNSLRWTLRSVVWQLLVAYGGAFAVYQVATLLGRWFL